VPAETPLRFHPEAEDEMNVTADWYDEHANSGSDFLAAFDETVEDIAGAPARWPLVKGITPPTRRRLMKRYPYSVFYRIDDRRAYVYLGRGTGISSAQLPITLIGTEGDPGGFGGALAGVGDINGDGYADVAVGARMANGDTGLAYLYFGGASAIAAPTQPVILSGPDGGAAGFGGAVAGAGDTDGDGYADLLVAADPTGKVYLYRGTTSATLGLGLAATFAAPADASSFFGYALASAEPASIQSARSHPADARTHRRAHAGGVTATFRPSAAPGPVGRGGVSTLTRSRPSSCS
jgi:FG-GAP repeat/ParE toxin of type II toxin-antitoxin system, parDE